MENFINYPNNLQALINQAAVNENGVTVQMPVYLGKILDGSDRWLMPNATISLRSRNIIVRRKIAKVDRDHPERSGSVKELWTQDDYEIIISGLLKNTVSDELPSELIGRLKNICTHPGPVYLNSAITTALSIYQIAITKYELPPTEGMQYQRYTIKGFSDDADVLFL